MCYVPANAPKDHPLTQSWLRIYPNDRSRYQ